MAEFSVTPLAQLSEECAISLRQEGERRCEACRELAYRALCEGNDAAWDLLLAHLWPMLQGWIYAVEPEVTPAVANVLGYRALWSFRRRWANRSVVANYFPTFPVLLQDLRRVLMQLLASRIE